MSLAPRHAPLLIRESPLFAVAAKHETVPFSGKDSAMHAHPRTPTRWENSQMSHCSGDLRKLLVFQLSAVTRCSVKQPRLCAVAAGRTLKWTRRKRKYWGSGRPKWRLSSASSAFPSARGRDWCPSIDGKVAAPARVVEPSSNWLRHRGATLMSSKRAQ